MLFRSVVVSDRIQARCGIVCIDVVGLLIKPSGSCTVAVCWCCGAVLGGAVLGGAGLM